jgi:hypothetical protein
MKMFAKNTNAVTYYTVGAMMKQFFFSRIILLEKKVPISIKYFFLTVPAAAATPLKLSQSRFFEGIHKSSYEHLKMILSLGSLLVILVIISFSREYLRISALSV